jgi:hypothetical protein
MRTSSTATISTASEVDPKRTELTRELDALSRKYGIVIVDGRVEAIDMAWDAPDAEQWAQYGLTSDGSLVRGFFEI